MDSDSRAFLFEGSWEILSPRQIQNKQQKLKKLKVLKNDESPKATCPFKTKAFREIQAPKKFRYIWSHIFDAEKMKFSLYSTISENQMILFSSFFDQIFSKKFFLNVSPLWFRKAERASFGGARESHWAMYHNRVTPHKTKEFLKSPHFFRFLW